MAFAAAERHQVTPKSGHPVQQQLAAEEADHSQVTTGGSGESTNNDTVMGDKDRWYHGNLSRVECEAVLKKNGFTEGLFVVRESQSASGDFVLSVVHAGEVIHYQIRRRGEDAIFSLSEEQKVIHGLDELIFYYQHQPHSGLQHQLVGFVPAARCPNSVRLHGVENLLHRATFAGNATVVQELLNCRDRDIEAKNHEGHCAIHLASFYGHIDVLQLLIDFGANVNVANSSGYTPLHVACQSNRAEAVCVLLQAKANPTARNQLTSWVPLHEAAWNGFIRCAEALLADGDAPLMPRTSKDETPADLARANGMGEMADMLDAWHQGEPSSDRKDWLHPESVGRPEAVELLSQGQDDGTFLIRKSGKKKNVYVLSMMVDKACFHFVIEGRGIFSFLDAGPYMVSLEHLVDHYGRFPDGLPYLLRHPVAPIVRSAISAKPVPLPPLLLQSHQSTPSVPPRVVSRERNVQQPSNLKPVDNRALYENNDILRRVRHSRDRIPSESVHMIQVIGEGEFGVVYKGLYMNEKGETRAVAVKVFSEINEKQSKDFAREAQVMMQVDHHCIVQLVGVCIDSPGSLLMVLELVPLGSMLDFLRENKLSVREDMELPLWAAQIACGMMYLEKQNFIHRDLAARNILLASKLQAKISDFGLSTVLGDGKDYYQASTGGRWPIKWYAPESVNYGKFSHASDVWSYGVLLWEMYTFGDQPYNGLTGMEVVKFIDSGKRLMRPEKAEIEVYSFMTWCWEEDPSKRPKFSELFKFFAENPEYSNLKELMLTQDLAKLP